MSEFDWQTFLKRWSQQWLEDPKYRAEVPPEVVASGWLGYPAASEEQLAAAEARLGVTLPPSYRAFLRVSNGWRESSPFIYHLWSSEEVEWLSVRNRHLIDLWADPEYGLADTWEGRFLPTALEVSDWGDSGLYILNPRAVRADGEWEAAFFANWHPGAEVYGSFRELMEAEYESFRELRGKGLA